MVPQLVVLFRLSAWRAGARRRGRQATGGPGVTLMWCVVLCRTSRWTPVGLVSSGNSTRRPSIVSSVAMVFTLGTNDGAVLPGVDSDATPSRRRLFLQSTRP
jgi:hypothetical protein